MKYRKKQKDGKYYPRCSDCLNFQLWGIRLYNKIGDQSGTAWTNLKVKEWVDGGYEQAHPSHRRMELRSELLDGPYFKYQTLDSHKHDIIPDFLKRQITVSQIAEKYRVKRGSVYRWLRSNGVPYRGHISEHEIKELLYLYVEKQMTLVDIAKKMNISPMTVKRHLIKFNKYKPRFPQMVRYWKTGLTGNVFTEKQVDSFQAIGWERKEEIRTIVRAINFRPPEKQKEALLERLRQLEPGHQLLTAASNHA